MDLRTPILSYAAPHFKFDGQRQNYFQFHTMLKAKFQFHKLSYLLDEAAVDAKLVEPILPDILTPPIYNQATCNELNARARDKYNNQINIYNKWKDRIPEDYEKAVSIILDTLHTSVITQIQTVLNAHLNHRQTFRALLAHLRTKFGPCTAQDASDTIQELRELTANNGLTDLLVNHEQHQLTLQLIPKLDPNGVPIPEANYKLNDGEMKAILINQLQHHPDTEIRHLITEAYRNPITTYEQMVDHIKLYIKQNEKSPDTINKPVVTTTSNTFKSSIQSTPNLDTKITCMNCKAIGHWASNCPSKTCYTCNLTFKTNEDRKTHAQQEHSRKRRLDASVTETNKKPKISTPGYRPPADKPTTSFKSNHNKYVSIKANTAMSTSSANAAAENELAAQQLLQQLNYGDEEQDDV